MQLLLLTCLCLLLLMYLSFAHEVFLRLDSHENALEPSIFWFVFWLDAVISQMAELLECILVTRLIKRGDQEGNIVENVG